MVWIGSAFPLFCLRNVRSMRAGMKPPANTGRVQMSLHEQRACSLWHARLACMHARAAACACGPAVECAGQGGARRTSTLQMHGHIANMLPAGSVMRAMARIACMRTPPPPSVLSPEPIAMINVGWNLS